jgi:hypothetical protein
MTKFGWLALSGCIVAVIGVALLVWGFAHQSASYTSSHDTIERTALLNPPELGLYSSGTYGLSFAYPATATIKSDFTEPTPAWRAFAGSEEGTLIATVTVGAAEARIGMSENAEAVDGCLEAASPEQVQAPLEVGGIAWTVFSADELGTEIERRITSYRALHENACYAVETFEPLSDAGEPVSETELSSADISLVVQTFTFAR